jgi:hypothetical protein
VADVTTLDSAIVFFVLGLAAALGEARFKVADLRDRVRQLEAAQAEQSKAIAAALEQIRLDIREIKTVLEVRHG